MRMHNRQLIVMYDLALQGSYRELEMREGLEGSAEPLAEGPKDDPSGPGDTANTSMLSKPEPDKQEARHLDADPSSESTVPKAADPPPPLPG